MKKWGERNGTENEHHKINFLVIYGLRILRDVAVLGSGDLDSVERVYFVTLINKLWCLDVAVVCIRA